MKLIILKVYKLNVMQTIVKIYIKQQNGYVSTNLFL